jgi:hypothetical protein
MRKRRFGSVSCTSSAPCAPELMGPGEVAVVVVILLLVSTMAWAGSSPLSVVELLFGSGVLAVGASRHCRPAVAAPRGGRSGHGTP